MSIVTFYAVAMWTLRYWAWGAGYTIVKNRHIGLDIGTGRRAIDVPAIWGGKVVRVIRTQSMGFVVVLDTGLSGAQRYHSYCHMSGDRLPKINQTIRQGARVGRLAAGPKSLPFLNVDFPGSLWDGIHLHLVFSSHIAGAYTKGTGSDYANPEELIREVLAKLTNPKPGTAGGGSRPVPTPISPEEDDDMKLDDKLPGTNFTVAEAITLTFQQNTQGIPGRKTDGERVRAEKQILAEVAANGAALDAMARVIEKLSGGVASKAEILAAVKSETSAGVKAALKNMTITLEAK